MIYSNRVVRNDKICNSNEVHVLTKQMILYGCQKRRLYY